MKRRIIALSLCIMLTVLSLYFPESVVASENGINKTVIFNSDNFSVEYSVINEWEENYIVEMVISNTGEDTIYNWAIWSCVKI